MSDGRKPIAPGNREQAREEQDETDRCPHCLGEIDPYDINCPHCGERLVMGAGKYGIELVLVVVGIVILVTSAKEGIVLAALIGFVLLVTGLAVGYTRKWY